MRQVPEKEDIPYLIVGNGKLAKHLKFYFNSLDISYSSWNRNSSIPFHQLAGNCQKILVAISDTAIEEFICENELSDKLYIHFSGALEIETAESVHPLMTFSDILFEESFYKSIPFVTTKGRIPFKDLFPELANPSYQIESDQKTFYHTWCSIAGNFTSILWTEFFNTFEAQLGIDKSAAYPYLKKISENLISSSNPLTGPLARGDSITIQRHLLALDGEDIENVYKAFVEFYNHKLKSN